MDDELASKYQQKTDKGHILDNPDTYIGSVEEIDSLQWVLNDDGSKIIEKNIRYIPGLFKLFDEGIVNCRDHVVRMDQAIKDKKDNSIPVSHIEISVDDTGLITMLNDGNGIDVAEHPEYKIWIPELIFGHLRTSTNYNKDEKKIVGGKNGFGFKLVLIWSTFGSIETVDHVRGLKYKQDFKQNLDIIEKPSITKCKLKPYTKISFRPDYARLGIHGLTSDWISLLKKRVYDVAAVTDKNLKVKYNSNLIPIKNFQQYIDMYIGDKTVAPRVFEEANERWEYAVALSPTHEFVQVSFVNGINTAKGGKHVEYILGQITRKMVDYIESKKKVKVSSNSIKEQLFLFIRCDIENPAFDSQTKDYMNTPSAKFGSKCEVSDKFIEKLAKIGVMDAACAITEVKENKAVKKTDGVKSKNVYGIPKLIDANFAGLERSKECTLILCEGDSAKSGIVSGLSSEDRDFIGIYPMKGKILNVRGEPSKKLADNKEITEIKKILGLESGKTYSSMEDIATYLRYGRILFMTDQDLDGSHIKGLGINLFNSEWPSLAEIPGFIGFMNTPILKARRGNEELMFYNNGEYDAWKNCNNISGWNVKYYKGLGTSTGKEFKEYFRQKRSVGFIYSGEDSNNAIDMVFNKKRADDRKTWLENYNRDSFLNTSLSNVTYEDFIHKELIHFSKYDCDRSIPNLMDGLKISLRKILFAAFKKNLTSEIKVAQFSGYVSEHSCYHHGEASLNQAIKGLAQNFVGSNNINLLFPSGQFGTRMQGGDDAASERYIFTRLEKITRFIFPQSDDDILTYLDDDGTVVEPIFYAPIIPMILVNGTKGIGTGFSTDIMCYNPLQIIQYLIQKLENPTTFENTIDFLPFYEGFQGTVLRISDNKFLIKGKYENLGNDKIKVTELPVGFWTEDFKTLLEDLIEPPVGKDGKKGQAFLKDYQDLSRDTNVDFTITFSKGKLEELEAIKLDHDCNGVDKLLKLFTTNTSTNMRLFDAKDKLKKYESVPEIIDDYFVTRFELFEKRKANLIQKLEKELVFLSNKARYIQETLDGKIDLRKKSKQFVIDLLHSKSFSPIDEEFKYLTRLPMDSVTNENVEKIFKEHKEKEKELEITIATSPNQMWLNELNVLKNEYSKYLLERKSFSDDGETPKEKEKEKKVVVKRKVVVKK